MYDCSLLKWYYSIRLVSSFFSLLLSLSLHRYILLFATDLATLNRLPCYTFIIYICLLFIGLWPLLFRVTLYTNFSFFDSHKCKRCLHSEKPTTLSTGDLNRGCSVATATYFFTSLTAVVIVIVVVPYKLMYKCKLNDLNDLLYIFFFAYVPYPSYTSLCTNIWFVRIINVCMVWRSTGEKREANSLCLCLGKKKRKKQRNFKTIGFNAKKRKK